MTRSPDDLPPALSSLWRTVKLGYRAEPRGLVLAFTMTVVTALPDALIALWLKLLADGVGSRDRTTLLVASLGLAASATATWFLRVVFTRIQRRFRDKIAVALEAHVATLQASVATIEHHERPDYLDRLSVLRDQVFALDHLFMSLFSTMGWIIRLVVTLVLLVSVSPSLAFLLLFAIPIVITSTWRPGVERRIEEAATPHDRLAKHLFLLGTTAPPGKELRVAGLGGQLQRERRESWDRWYEPISRARMITALWHTAAWALFGGAYVGAIVYVAVHLHAGVGNVVLVVTAGSRLSQYVGAAVGELGFLRGIWLDSSRRLAWLEDYAASRARTAEVAVPARITDAIRLEHVSFSYPGTDHDALTDVNLELPAGAVIALVGENGAGKSTLVKLLADMYTPTSGRITIDGVDLAKMAPDEWRDHLAGAFQDFYRFELLAQASVGVGDHPNIDERPAVERAVARAGAADVIEGLAAGLDTQLGPTWDSGVDVSFGQWQKLALSRGFMRDEPLLLVLDEPTAALDAETEHALFERFADAARTNANPNGRVTILVSHRFSTVRMADLIVVLDGARAVEVGTHEELMARAGHYAELYAIQARGVPLMAARSLRIVNQSSYTSARVDAAIDAIGKAIRIQLREVARAWGEYVWTVVDDANRQGFQIVLLDDDDAAGTLGYHDLNENDGTPYARVFIKPIIENGGTWLRGANSVAVTASHEACELVGDPTANHWVENARGALVAAELCDPVESCAYPITLRDGRRVSMSDFVFPDWFNPYAPAGTQLDRMSKVRKPFEIAPDGYVIHHTRSGVRNIWGREYPHWRKAAKRRYGSRTRIRHRLG